MSIEYQYYVHCDTETASNGGDRVVVLSDWVLEKPTVCPNDPLHTIDPDKTVVKSFRYQVEEKTTTNFSTSSNQIVFITDINKTPEFGRWFVSFSGSVQVADSLPGDDIELSLFKNGIEIDATRRYLCLGRESVHTQAIVECSGEDLLQVGLRTSNTGVIINICAKSLITIPV